MNWINRLSFFAVLAAILLAVLPSSSAQSDQERTTPPIVPVAHAEKKAVPSVSSTPANQPTFVNCHALEAHTSTQPAVTIVVFNQRDKKDHVKLSDLLKQNDGTGVEVRAGDGKWHRATVARLRSCFGRGLLFLSGDAAGPKDREDFLLRFPSKKIS